MRLLYVALLGLFLLNGCRGALGLDDYSLSDSGTGSKDSGKQKRDSAADPVTKKDSDVPKRSDGSQDSITSDVPIPEPPECEFDNDCPFATNGCQSPRCENNTCGVDISPAGARPCSGATQCDGFGNCVDCLINQEKDSDETDVDCGGELCEPCDDDRRCRSDIDCKSRRCKPHPSSDFLICHESACNDGKKNGDEVDVDCGGEECYHKCTQGRSCSRASDCETGFCVNGVCCGVPCDGACRECVLGSGACRVATAGKDPGDACPGLSNVCTEEGVCSRCQNEKFDSEGDGAESDWDCGGDVCPKCPNGSTCRVETDCLSGNCLNGRCEDPSCGNDALEESESETGCGMSCGIPCGVGKACSSKLDCASRNCVEGKCVP